LAAFTNYQAANAQGQTANPDNYDMIADILPPSPNAASLGKYGGIDLNLSSGAPNINIPVYDYHSISLDVPISLTYNSGGIRVDEIGGRVGMSWNLQAGGVITRTVLGKLDENSTRLTPPPNFLTTEAGAEFVDAVSVPIPLSMDGDSQPDLFSFNFLGYSGRFILDSSFNPVLLTYSNLKIESSLTPANQFLFKITDGNGVQYLFGGDWASEMTSQYSAGSSCGKAYPNPAVTAWYLTSIIHPNGDTIWFDYQMKGTNYKTSISETLFHRNETIGPNNCMTDPPTWPVLNNSTCVNWLRTNAAFLEQISSSGGAKIKFRYSDRTDLNDSLLSSIEIYQPGNSTPFRIFDLTYQFSVSSGFGNTYTISDASLKYRPFLVSLTERSYDNSLSRSYQFSYNDINGLPPRLSFARDDYGFFNGKNNSTLIPRPDFLFMQQEFPSATANRGPDSTYGFKGLLTRIVYPTGGKDSIIYEAHKIYFHQPVYESPVTINATANSDDMGGFVTVLSDNASIHFEQEAELYASCILRPGYSEDAIHDKSVIKVIDLTDNNTLIVNQLLDPVNVPSFSTILSLQPGHTYQISVTSYGAGVSGAASFDYIPGDITYIYVNKMVCGGGRVSKIISDPADSGLPVIKRYFYNQVNNPAASSAGMVYTPTYAKGLMATQVCQDGGVGHISCLVNDFSFLSMYSNTLFNLYLYAANPVAYSTVFESFGDNFENGGIEHEFLLAADDPASPMRGMDILGAPGTSYSWKNGRETYTRSFGNSGGTFLPVKEVWKHYNEDSRVYGEFRGYVVNKRYIQNCTPDSDIPGYMNAYDIAMFKIFRTWVYPDTITTYDYAQNGVDYIKQVNITQYGNTSHAMPTRIITNLSDNRNETVNNFYPDDLTLTGAAETGRQNLISKHILNPVLEQTISKGARQTYLLSRDYNVFGNGLVLPRNTNVQTLNNSLEKRVDFTRYNAAGRISEQYKTNDQKQVDLWDYRNMYLVAQVSNADSADVAYNSFEADGKGNWSFTGSSSPDPGSPTGDNCYNISQGISKTGLNTGNTYIVAFCKKAGASVSVSGSVSSQQGRTINNWTYVEYKVTGVSTVSLSGSGYIDELRLYPAAAQMTTYTYNPLIGISSTCDPAGKITYYGYDGLGRMIWVKDQDGNVIKTIQYHYKGQALP
jgi:YD repeat-containing protein